MSLSPLVSFQSRFVTYLLTYPRNTIFEGKQCRTDKGIFVFLWNLKVHFCVHRSLNHLNLFSTLVPYIFNIHFNTVFHLC